MLIGRRCCLYLIYAIFLSSLCWESGNKSWIQMSIGKQTATTQYLLHNTSHLFTGQRREKKQRYEKRKGRRVREGETAEKKKMKRDNAGKRLMI